MTTISHKLVKIVAILQHNKRVFGILSLHMHRNDYIGASGQKSDPAVCSGDLDFLSDRCISITRWRLLDIFDVFVLLHRVNLWPWPLPFDSEDVSNRVLLMPDCLDYPKTHGYWVTIIEFDNNHCACPVSHDL